MFPRRSLSLALLIGLAALPATTIAQGPPDSAALMAAQREAMSPLAFMDGVWRGPAWTILPGGEKHAVTQTERIGAFLGGCVKLLEGRGYNPDSTVGFNALGIVSFDPGKKAYTLHSYAMGRVGDFAFTPAPDGFMWEIPAGPTTLRYTATVKDGRWREVGERVLPGKVPVQFFEMNLVRVGDTDWPAAGAVRPR